MSRRKNMFPALLVIYCSHKCKDSWQPAGDTFPFAHCGAICPWLDVLVPNGYAVQNSSVSLCCWDVISYAIKSSCGPGTWVHVWDERAFKKLSPSLLQQQAWLEWRCHSAALLGSAGVCACVCMCARACVYVSVAWQDANQYSSLNSFSLAPFICWMSFPIS